MSEKSRENRIRRLAHREGMRLHKLRDDGGFWLFDNAINCLVIGQEITRGVRIGYDLDVFGEYLSA